MIEPTERTRIEELLYREARLLDEARYDEWLSLLADDIHYWMPGVEVRYRADPMGAYGSDRMAYFDDTLETLRRRVSRLQNPSAWPEDPATRHLHLISNVEVERGDHDGELTVHSVVTTVRGVGRTDRLVMYGRRRDVWRRDGPGYLLSRRRVVITDNVLAARNINTFL